MAEVLEDMPLDIEVVQLTFDDLGIDANVSSTCEEDLGMSLDVTDGVVLEDLPLNLEVTDGTVCQQLSLNIAIIKEIPVFKAIYAMHLASIMSEVT